MKTPPLKQMKDSFVRMKVLSEICDELASKPDSESKLGYAKKELLDLAKVNSELIQRMKKKDHPH